MKTAINAALAAFEAREQAGIDTCTTCPRLCRWSCPVAETEARETSSPWNMVTLSGFVKRGLAAPAAAGALPFHCTQCGACTEACLHKNDVPLLLDLARARALAAHVVPDGIAEVRGHFAVSANAYGVSLEPALAAVVAEGGAGETRAEPGEADVYLPGCATLAERPAAAAGFLKALAVRGIDGVVTTPASAACCGLPLLWAGDVVGFRAHAERFAARLAGARRVIVHDAACAEALGRRYADFGVTFAPQVITALAFLVEKLGVEVDEAARPAEGSTASAPAAYLDTCHLARSAGQVDGPRALVARATGAAPCELPGLRGRAADCCGAAGLLPTTVPETARAMGEARLEAFATTGARELVVGTPRCAAHLARLSPSTPIVDLTTLLARLA
jgi:Fe-S oxidoreductase